MNRATLLASVLLLVLGLVAQPRPAQAQLGLDAEYIAPDGSFKFNYPLPWLLQPGSALEPVEVAGDSALLHIYGPASLDALSLGALNEPEDLAQAYLSLTRGPVQANAAPFMIPLAGRPAARLDTLDRAGKPKILLAVAFQDGRLGLIEVVTTGAALVLQDQETALAIAASFDAPPAPPAPASPLLRQYAADWRTAVNELEQAGIIPFGGGLIYTEDLVPFGGAGAFFSLLAQELPARDVVVSGGLVFTPSGSPDYESCALSARVTLPDGQIGTYLEVGFNNSGALFYQDHTGNDATRTSDELAFNPVPGQPYHLLLIARGDRLSVYVNGLPAFRDVPVENRSGVFGVSFIGHAQAASCLGYGLWAYAIPATTSGVCEAVAGAPVHQRSGPGVGYPIIGQFPSGAVERIVGQHTDVAGYRWWQITNTNWVREDVVQAVGDCAHLPDTGF